MQSGPSRLPVTMMMIMSRMMMMTMMMHASRPFSEDTIIQRNGRKVSRLGVLCGNPGMMMAPEARKLGCWVGRRVLGCVLGGSVVPHKKTKNNNGKMKTGKKQKQKHEKNQDMKIEKK